MSKMRKPMILLLLLFINLLALVRGQEINPSLCTPNGNYSSNSTYSTNLNTLLNSLPSNMPNYGFYKSSLGGNQDSANALALCRADLTPDQCRECVGAAARELLASCKNQRQGVVWLEYCLVRYSNHPIPPNYVPDNFGYIMRNPQNVSAGNRYFREDVTRILADLRVEAANGSSVMKVGVGTRPTAEVNASAIYALLQCTPDLTSEDCRECLANISDRMLRVIDLSEGVRMFRPNCITRYELHPFYNQTRLTDLRLLPPLPPSPSPPPPGRNDDKPDSKTRKKQRNDAAKVVMITVPIGVCLALAVCIILIYLRKRLKKKRSWEITETMGDISNVESLAATADFSEANKLGRGGFGAVYKGKLENGQEIAVKRLFENSDQGNTEFKNEVLLVAKLQHRNLVRLLGFSLEGMERLLVYEFVQNASLDHFIFASNVLLDGDMNPKIADFGMARLSRHDEIQGNTNKIVGTYGYMAPEYAMHGGFSIKSDVFSFEVLILDIISGQKNNFIRCRENVEDLLTLTWGSWRRGAAADMIDPLLQNRTSSSLSLSQMLKCIHIGLLCVQENAANRPTMTSVLHMLNASLTTFPQP